MYVDHSEGRDVAEVRDGLPERVVRRLQAELNQLAVAHCKRRGDSELISNVWVFIQLIFSWAWQMNQLNRNLNMAELET